MAELRKELNDILINIKKTKLKFKKIIKYINNHDDIKNNLTDDQRKHIQSLIDLWRKDSGANIDYYFKMKEHHTHINNTFTNETLKTMWQYYIMDSLSFRTALMDFSHKIRENQDSLGFEVY